MGECEREPPVRKRSESVRGELFRATVSEFGSFQRLKAALLALVWEITPLNYGGKVRLVVLPVRTQ